MCIRDSYGTTYFKLIAVADGYGASAPTETTVKFQVSKPTVSIEQGNYKQALSIQLSCGTKGAVIYYTTDGSLVLCQDLVQVKMRNFSHFNLPKAQP